MAELITSEVAETLATVPRIRLDVSGAVPTLPEAEALSEELFDEPLHATATIAAVLTQPTKTKG